MKKYMIILTLLWGVFSFSNSVYAITVGKVIDSETGQELSLIETTIGNMAFDNEMKDNLDNLKIHTVIVKQREYTDKIRYYHAAGIAIDSRHILTVNHIVQSDVRSDNYYQANEGSAAYLATVVKVDPLHDIALLEIDKTAPDLIAQPMAFANNLTEGELVYTIGHPDNYYDLSVGTVDSKGEGYNDIEGYQINVDIHDGNSGGFVINASGEIVGMVFSAATMISNWGYMIGFEDIQNFLK